MTRERILWGVFALACLAQLAFASSSMWQAESALRRGTLHTFRTDPVDPVDPFRGRYVALTFRTDQVPVAEGATFERGETAWVELGVDAEGYARLVRAHAGPPDADHLSLPVLGGDASQVTVQLPFDRYYAEEERALEIDRQRWRAGGRFRVGVRVLDGRGVIESLELAEVPMPLLASDLLRPDPEAPLPDGLFDSLRASLRPGEEQACRKARCVLFEVDLDRRVSPEFVFQDPDGTLWYWLDTAGRWRRVGWLISPDAGPMAPQELLLALRESGAGSADPLVRDLRVGERTWAVRFR